MNATELMLGDIVSVSGNPMHVTFAMMSAGIEVKPLSLTREILERNGFSDSYKDRSLAKDNVFKWYDWYGHCVTVDMNGNAIKIQHDSRVLLDLRYNLIVPVSELQHALKMCGIEKEVVI